MTPTTSIPEAMAEQGIAALVRSIRESEQQLHVLTGGQVDAVTGVGGQPFLLRNAQEELRRSERAQRQLAQAQIAILNALPAHIALVNAEGEIVSVNGAWSLSADALQGSTCGVGENYLNACEQAQGMNIDQGCRIAAGLRGVLRNQLTNFTLEYAHNAANDEERWFKLIITPLGQQNAAGAVITLIDITELKLSEESLELFRSLIDQSNDAIEVVDFQTGRFLDVNERAWQRLGYSREEMLALHLSDIEVKSATECTISDDMEEIRRAGFKTVEGRHRRKDGTSFPIEANVRHINLKRGYLVAVVRDITERKETELALRVSETRYRSLAKATSQIVWTANVEGKVHGALPEWQEYTGQSFEEIQNDGWATALHPDDREFVFKVWTEAVGTRTHYDTEYRLRRHDGIYRDFTVRGIPFLIQNGGISEWVGCCTDITERKRAEEHIEEQAALLDETQDAIIVCDLRGHILFWNKGAEKMFGWVRHDVLGKSIAETVYTDPVEFGDINKTIITSGAWSGELDHIAKDRRKLVIEGRCTLVRDQKGRPKSVLAIYTDITEKKEIEAQFMRAQRMESIGTLAAGIAHDLNNILTPILMSIDLLKNTSDSPQTRKTLQTIEVSAKRGADIVRQVLSFATGLEGQRIGVQPAHLLKDLGSIIQDTFPKNIRLSFSVPSNLWMISGDPTQLNQVLMNLSVNARDAMPKGGRLTVSVGNCVLDEGCRAVQSDAKPGPYVRITVADSGVGIPPKVLDRIFEPFFTTKGISKGSGLGLSTVAAIVKSHGGIIKVESDPGNGTTFNVYLPATHTSGDVLTDESFLENMPRGNGETVLVVDDEPSILNITRQTLEAYGYCVLTARDGADALSIYLQYQQEVAVVLTDMMMPVMDGAALIHALKGINPAIKVIAASGLNNGGDADKTVEAVKHFIIKPYTASTVLKTIRTILDEG